MRPAPYESILLVSDKIPERRVSNVKIVAGFGKCQPYFLVLAQVPAPSRLGDGAGVDRADRSAGAMSTRGQPEAQRVPLRNPGTVNFVD